MSPLSINAKTLLSRAGQQPHSPVLPAHSDSAYWKESHTWYFQRAEGEATTMHKTKHTMPWIREMLLSTPYPDQLTPQTKLPFCYIYTYIYIFFHLATKLSTTSFNPYIWLDSNWCHKMQHKTKALANPRAAIHVAQDFIQAVFLTFHKF